MEDLANKAPKQYKIGQRVEYTIKHKRVYTTNTAEIIDIRIIDAKNDLYLYHMDNNDKVFPSEIYKKIIKSPRRKLL